MKQRSRRYFRIKKLIRGIGKYEAIKTRTHIDRVNSFIEFLRESNPQPINHPLPRYPLGAPSTGLAIVAERGAELVIERDRHPRGFVGRILPFPDIAVIRPHISIVDFDLPGVMPHINGLQDDEFRRSELYSLIDKNRSKLHDGFIEFSKNNELSTEIHEIPLHHVAHALHRPQVTEQPPAEES